MQVALVYPERQRWPKFAWVQDALRGQGHRVTVVRDVEQLVEADKTAELVLFEHKEAGLGCANLIQAAKQKRAFWCQWYFDLVAQENKPLAEQVFTSPQCYLPIMRAMDLVCVKERGLLADYAALGVNATWLDQACPSWLAACEHRESPEWDVLVIGSTGSPFYTQRCRDVQALVSAGCKVAWCGHTHGSSVPAGVEGLPFCEVKDLPALASRTAVVLDVCGRHDLDGYWSDRLWLLLGMGACVVRRLTPGQPDLAYASYETREQLIGWVRDLRLDAGRRRDIGSIARAQVLAGHTYEHRVMELLELCRLTREINEPVGTAAEMAA